MQIIELGIDKYLISGISLFFINRKVRLVIDGHENKNMKIETEMPQSFPVSPILFFIYMSEIFN